MKIVITAPSLDETRNVSGISTVVRQIIEHSGHEFVHFQAGREDGERSGPAWLLKQALMPFRFRRLVESEDADIVHINTALTDRSIWRDAALARMVRKPIVLSIHGGRYLLENIESPRLERATSGLLRAAKSVVVLGEFEKEHIERRWKGLDIRVLPNAIATRNEEIAIRKNTDPVVLFLGRLHESKGLAVLAEACKRIVDEGIEFQFRCFGDGPMKIEFIASMSEVLGEKFYYGGVVTGDAKVAEYDRADIFVLPSIYGEGLPMAILEAMDAGCVVVASDMASVSAVITDGVNGFLVEPGNVEQLSRVLRGSLIERNRWLPVSEAASATVQRDFAIQNYIAKLDAIYNDAIK